MDTIFGAGFSPKEVARRIRSTPPTVRAIWRDQTEPKHSQGMYLINMCKAIKAGKLHAREK